jgi:hypothetical protein
VTPGRSHSTTALLVDGDSGCDLVALDDALNALAEVDLWIFGRVR